MSSGRIADLVIVGVPKAATGSLFAYLAQHPDVCGSDIKELGYFNHFNPARTQHIGPPPPIEEYARHWAHWSGERYALEATPTYSYGGRPVIDAMRSLLGRPKIILILRDPAERLWSAYTFQHSVGNNARIGSFAEYLDVPAEVSVARKPDDLLGEHAVRRQLEEYERWLDRLPPAVRLDATRPSGELVREALGVITREGHAGSIRRTGR